MPWPGSLLSRRPIRVPELVRQQGAPLSYLLATGTLLLLASAYVLLATRFTGGSYGVLHEMWQSSGGRHSVLPELRSKHGVGSGIGAE